MDYKQITWLASYPKSGNTWLRLFLDAYILGDVDINDIRCSVQDDTSTRFGIGMGEDIRFVPVDIQHLVRGTALLRLVYQFDKYKPHPDFPLFVKSHTANIAANNVVMMPPNLTKCTVHIVRDPRDVCVSFAKHLGVDIDKCIEWMTDDYRTLNSVEQNRAAVADYISSWHMHTRSFVEGDGGKGYQSSNIKTFRYEYMVQKPMEAFCEILLHMGVNPDKERVQQALDAVALDKLRKQEEEKGFKEASPKSPDKFFGKGGHGGWRDVLKPYQVKAIEKHAGRFMEMFKYKGRLAA